ncbi:MAG: chain length determinant protein EpsF [Burkholderiales bacterium]|jgi:chain length determinant protein EpsF
MALEQFLRILWARRWLALATFVLIVGGTVAGTMVWPKKYAASAQVLLDLKGLDPVSGLPASASAPNGFLATELDVIRSTRVALRVVDALKLAGNPMMQRDHVKSGTEAPLREWIAEQLTAQLKVKPSRDSTVLEITYHGSDPKLAAVVANAFAKAYIDTTLELRVDPARQQVKWFEERAKTLREGLDAAQTRLSEYQRKTGIVSLDERFDIESARLSELSTQLVSLQALASESQKRAQIASDAVATGQITLSVLPEVLQSPTVQQMKADLTRLEGRQSELAANLGRNHPDYLKVSEEVAALRPRLLVEMKAVVTSLSRTAQLNAQRAAEVQASLERQRGKVLDLKERRDRFTVLARDVEAAQRAFDEVSQRSSKAGLESQLRNANVQLLDAAVPPMGPSSPVMLVNVIVAAVVGVLAAVGVVLLLELPDRRVRAVTDIAHATGLPVLGTVGARRRLLRRRPATPQLAAY